MVSLVLFVPIASTIVVEIKVDLFEHHSSVQLFALTVSMIVVEIMVDLFEHLF